MSLDAERIFVLIVILVTIVVVFSLHRSGKSKNNQSSSD